MVPTDVISRVRDQLVETTAAFWTNAELYRYMADAEREINLLTECNVVSTAATTTTSTSGYTLPADCLAVKRITFDGVPLKKIDGYMRDRDLLDMPGYGGTLTSGDPTHYYQINTMIYLWPTPSRGATVQYYYLGAPVEVASGSTAFTVPANFHNPIQDYILYRAFLKDQDQGKSEWYKREFEQGVSDAMRRENRRRWAGGFPSVKTEENYTAINGLT